MWLPFGCITWVCGPRLAGLFASLRTSKCIIRKKGTPYKESTCRSTGRTHRGTRSGLCSENATAAGQVPPRARAPWGHGNLGTEIPGKERPHQLLSQKCHRNVTTRSSSGDLCHREGWHVAAGPSGTEPHAAGARSSLLCVTCSSFWRELKGLMFWETNAAAV